MTKQAKINSRFDAFTEQARQVLIFAQEEAYSLQHDYIGTEHLLLGLIQVNEGSASKILTNLGIKLTDARSATVYISGMGNLIVPSEIGLTPQAKKAIELAVDLAQHLNHHHIGTEHLLICLLREGEGIASRVLDTLGVDREKIEEQILITLNPIDRPEYSKQSIQEQNSEIDIQSRFATDIHRILELEDQSQRDPQAVISLVQIYEQILKQLHFNEAPKFFSMMQNNLGDAYRKLPLGSRKNNLKLAIQCYQEALRFWTPEFDPPVHAMIQNNLGNTYADLPTNNPTYNLGKAILCYQEALKIWTPETAPLDYASVQHNLGVTYADLPTGNLVDNLTRAIQCYQEALRFRTPEADPLKYAETQNNLGAVYSRLPIGDPVDNLTRAIQCYQEALRFSTPETDPSAYAGTQNNLGAVYSRLPTGDPVDNLNLAIQCYQEALRFWTPKINPLKYAGAQNNLGDAYSNLPIDDRVDNLALAMQCYREALRFWTPDTHPLGYARTHNKLGIIYRKLPTGNRTDNLRQAIQCYREALHFQTAEIDPMIYAEIQNNLGNAYGDLLTGERAQSMELAIGCYQEALRFWTPDTHPAGYATVQNNLGVTYRDLPTGDRAENLTKTIHCCQEALRFRTLDTDPRGYAETQNNLGSAYCIQPAGDRAANLSHGILCFEEVLRFWTPDTHPIDYARAQANLGTAYGSLPTGNRATNLIRAIQCFEKALHFLTPKTEPLTYAQIQNNLGDTYRRLPTDDVARNIKQAILHYQEALQISTAEADPLAYSGIQNNLGLAYTTLAYKTELTDDRTHKLKLAVSSFKEALRFRTPQNDPIAYAGTQNNLGLAYVAQSAEANLAQATLHFKEALRFLTPETEPLACRNTAGFFAYLHFTQGSWDESLRAYRIAIEAGEQLYRAGLSTESKTVDVTESADFYPHAAFSAVRCGEITEAFLILERGKTRFLTEALRLNVHRPPHVPDTIWNNFEQAGAAVRAKQAERTSDTEQSERLFNTNTTRSPAKAYEAQLQSAQAAKAELDAAIEHVRAYDPHFLETIDLSAAENQIPDKQTALISFCITNRGSIGFVMSQRTSKQIRVVEMPDFTQKDLRHLLQDTHQQPVSGWLGDYNHYLTDRTNENMTIWQGTMTHVLTTLGKHIVKPLLSVLSTDIERLVLLPAADLFLFPLHAVPLPDGDPTQLLCDKYEISYAPSLEVRAHGEASIAQARTPSLYAVINPTENASLPFAPSEGASVAQLFTQSQIEPGHDATKERVLAGIQTQTYIHFACHGSYDWDDPSLSSLHLTGEQHLTLADLQSNAIDLSRSRLVTLSACETGITDVMRNSPAEYVGIPAGFLLAGVPCVIGSLWIVPDISTAMLMEHFYYQHLHKGKSIAAALREAQRWVRHLDAETIAAYATKWYRQTDHKDPNKRRLYKQMELYRGLADNDPTQCIFAHPYYWAAFTVNGL